MQVAGLPDHDHSCFLGSSAPDADPAIVAAVRDSADRGFRAMLVVGEGAAAKRRADRWHALLRTAHAAVDVVGAQQGYDTREGLDPARQVAAWEERVAAAREAGRDGLFVVGDMEWTRQADVPTDLLLDYEARVSELHARAPITGICDYSFAPPRSRDASRAASVHPAVRGTRPAVARGSHFSVSRAGDRELRLAGELDGTGAAALGEALLPVIAWHRDVTLLVEEVEFADIAALRALARVGTELRGRGHRLVLRGPSAALRRAIVTCRWAGVLLPEVA